MLLSIILAWLAVFFAVMTALKFIARVSKNRALNRFFAKVHMPFGVLLLITGLLHGILAGNPASATLTTFMVAPVLLTWNWGTACFVLAIALALTYVFRKKLKKHWMPAHRILTVMLVACLVLHVSDTGIQLFSRLSSVGTTTASVISASSSTTSSATSSASGGTTSAASGSTTSSTTSSTASGTTSSTTSSTASSSAASSSDSSTSSTVSTESTTTSTTGDAVTFSGATLADGTYQGSATGYQSTITVSVTVSGGAVTDITVVSESDTPQYWSRAVSLLTTIVSQQSLDVDAVTGATYSSAGIINAVANALSGAVTSGTLEINNINLSAIKGGH